MSQPLIFTERRLLPRIIDVLLTIFALVGFLYLIYKGLITSHWRIHRIWAFVLFHHAGYGHVLHPCRAGQRTGADRLGEIQPVSFSGWSAAVADRDWKTMSWRKVYALPVNWLQS